jgi:hypothetical protein
MTRKTCGTCRRHKLDRPIRAGVDAASWTGGPGTTTRTLPPIGAAT